MMTLNSYLSIVTLNMNGLNDRIKRRRVSDWIKKQDPIQASIQKLERTQVQKLTLHIKELEKKQQIDPTPSRRRELIKIRAELNEIKTRRTVEQINRTRSWYFERINKIDKSLSCLLYTSDAADDVSWV